MRPSVRGVWKPGPCCGGACRVVLARSFSAECRIHAGQSFVVRDPRDYGPVLRRALDAAEDDSEFDSERPSHMAEVMLLCAWWMLG